MIGKQEEKVIKQGEGLIKKCIELDRAMSLSKKNPRDLNKIESEELRKLEAKLRRFIYT